MKPMKEIKDDITRWERHSMFLGRKVKMTMLPNTIYRFNAIPIKLPMAFFTELDQKILLSIETQKIPNNQSSLEKGA